MIGVAINMNGGPATVWGPRALAAYLEYSSAGRHREAALERHAERGACVLSRRRRGPA